MYASYPVYLKSKVPGIHFETTKLEVKLWQDISRRSPVGPPSLADY